MVIPCYNSRQFVGDAVGSAFRQWARVRELLTKPTPVRLAEDTVVIWEPSTVSHAEVVPGFARYVLDLGYTASILVDPRHIEAGLFSRFADERLLFNTHSSRREIRRALEAGLASGARAILATSSRNVSQEGTDYQAVRAAFRHGEKVLLVDHDFREPMEQGFHEEDTISLGRIACGDHTTRIVNPHYFGEVAVTGKNAGRTRFLVVGGTTGDRKDMAALWAAMLRLERQRSDNFEVRFVGRSAPDDIPSSLGHRVVICGALPFDELYREMENADFLLPLLNPAQQALRRYMTTGSSGIVQLCYGFRKPCVIDEAFGRHYFLTEESSVFHQGSDELAAGMQLAISMSAAAYQAMQSHLEAVVAGVRQTSLRNLGELISRAPAR